MVGWNNLDHLASNIECDTTEQERTTGKHLTKDLINGVVTGQSAVEYTELPLQSLWNVISAPSWVNHGRQELNIGQISEVTGFLQVIETFVLHNLTDYFIGYLRRYEKGSQEEY